MAKDGKRSRTGTEEMTRLHDEILKTDIRIQALRSKRKKLLKNYVLQYGGKNVKRK